MPLDGSVSKVGVFVQMSGGIGPDGMAMDEAGNLAVCHPGIGAAWLFLSSANHTKITPDSCHSCVNTATFGESNCYRNCSNRETSFHDPS
jgi:hypothetical protein